MKYALIALLITGCGTIEVQIPAQPQPMPELPFHEFKYYYA